MINLQALEINSSTFFIGICICRVDENLICVDNRIIREAVIVVKHTRYIWYDVFSNFMADFLQVQAVQ